MSKLAELYDSSVLATTLKDGSAEQIDAANEFGELLREHLTVAAFRRWERYALKATTQEMVDYGWKLMDMPRARQKVKA